MSTIDDLPVSAIARLLRKLPQHWRGKQRIARAWVGLTRSANQPCRMPGVSGLEFAVPNLRDSIGLSLLADGAYEQGTVEWLTHAVAPGHSLLDIGANIGSVALHLAKCRPDLTIDCVEASPIVYPFLVWNVARNALHRQIATHALALSDSPLAEIEFYSPSEGYGKGSLSPVFTSDGVRVANRRLDDFVAVLPKVPDALKIDVEGYERQVLDSGRVLLGTRGPDIAFEFCDWAERLAGNAPGDSQVLLLDFGYRLFRMCDGVEIARPQIEGFEMIWATRQADFSGAGLLAKIAAAR